MITEQWQAGTLTYNLAGALVGDWVAELERCWRAAALGLLPAPQRLVIDLTEVVFVDERGKALLALMAEAGAEFIAGDILMKSIVDEITHHTFVSMD